MPSKEEVSSGGIEFVKELKLEFLRFKDKVLK